MLAFNYTVVDYINQELDAQLTFDNPNAVSSLIDLDALIVRLQDVKDYGEV